MKRQQGDLVSRRQVLTTMLGGTAMMAASGCGITGTNPAQDPEVSLGPITGSVTFQTLQLSPTYDAYLGAVVKAFSAKYPQASVRLVDIPSAQATQKLSADAVSGSLPDVVDLTPEFAAPLARRGLLLPVDKYAADVKSVYVPSQWDSFKVGGDSAVALPWYLNTGLLMYNSDLMRRAGLDPNQPPKTFEELFSAAAKIASAGQGFYAFHLSLKVGLLNNLRRAGVPMIDPASRRSAFATPRAAEYLNRMRDLFQAKALPPDSVTADTRADLAAFQQGQTVFFESGPSRLKLIKDNAPTTFPNVKVSGQVTGTAGTFWVLPHGVGVSAASKNVAAALAFAKFITDATNQLTFSKETVIFPSAAQALADPYFSTAGQSVEEQARRMGAEQILKGKAMVREPEADDEFAAPLIRAAEAAILGRTPADKALQGAAAEADQILARRPAG